MHHNYIGSMSAQIFSIIIHILVIWIGSILVYGYYQVFRKHPSNIAFAMVLLLSSIITTSIILGTSSVFWFYHMCLFSEINAHYPWIQILWTAIYSAGFVLLYLVLKRKVEL